MISYFITSAILLTVFLVLYKLLLEREKMHHFNRFYLIGALIIGLTAPLISFEISTNSDLAKDVQNLKETVVEAPAQQLEEVIAPSTADASEANSDELPEMILDAEPLQESAFNWWPVFFGIYGIVTLGLMIRFVWNIRFLLKQAHNHSAAKWKGAELVLLEDDIPPYSFMKYIYLNKQEYDNGEISDRVLHHELTHIHQKHSFDLLFIEVLRAVFWLNPAIHFFRPAIQLNHEFLADDAVIQLDQEQAEYQKELLKFAEAKTPDVVNTINYSLTKKRFEMMVKQSSFGAKTIRLSLMLPLISSVLLMYCVKVSESDALTPRENHPARVYDKPSVIQPSAIPQTILDKGLDVEVFEGYPTSGPNPVYSDITLYRDRTNLAFKLFYYDSDGELFSGIQTFFFESNNTVSATYQYEDGLMTLWTAFHGNGVEEMRTEMEYFSDRVIGRNYKDGKYSGGSVSWAENDGRLIKTQSIDEGDLSGTQTLYDAHLNQLETKYIGKNGKLVSHFLVEDSLYTFKWYHPNGSMKSEFSAFENGNGNMSAFIEPIRYNGVRATYLYDGTVSSKELWKNGELIEKIK